MRKALPVQWVSFECVDFGSVPQSAYESFSEGERKS